MSESESEDEILDRIEAALRKIAGMSGAPRPAASADDTLDRETLSEKLDDIIGKLRDGLGGLPPHAPAAASTETAPVPAVVEDEPPAEDDAPPEIWPEPGE